jgi:hypothetical protein
MQIKRRWAALSIELSTDYPDYRDFSKKLSGLPIGKSNLRNLRILFLIDKSSVPQFQSQKLEHLKIVVLTTGAVRIDHSFDSRLVGIFHAS